MKAQYNPFNPNGIVPSNLFAGRAKYCLSILSKLVETKHGRPSSFFLYGERGIGKSALARLLVDVASSANKDLYELKFLNSYYPVEPGQSLRSVIESSLNNLTDSMPASWLARMGERLGGLFKNGKFTIGAFGASASVAAAQEGAEPRIAAVRDQAISILANIINALKESEEKRDGILLIIDEIQNLSDIEIAAPLLRGILSSLEFKNLGHVSFLLLGLDQAFDAFMSGDISTRRNFDPIRLDTMPPDEAVQVLTKGFEKVELRWDEAALKSHIHVTGGYPHSIQVVGHHLVAADTDGFIGQTDWKAAIRLTAAELIEKEFSEMYSFSAKLTGHEKILNVLALSGHMPRKELSTKCREAYEMNNTYQYLPTLEQRGAIRILSDGTIELHSHLFRSAILSSLLPTLDPKSPLGQMWAKILDEIPVSPNTENPK